MTRYNRIAYAIATLGPLGAWSEAGSLLGALGIVFMWYLPQIAYVTGTVQLFGLELLAMGIIVVIIQAALKDRRVVWYGGVPVAPTIVIDWVLGAIIAVHGVPHVLFVYALAFLIYLLLQQFRPLGIRQARALPGVWGIIADDMAAGALTHIAITLIISILS